MNLARREMSELFTVKLDLSAVFEDNSEPKIYILMVDTGKTKMIYEFKMWIRFLFSFDVPIQLVYEGAVIHDLENIQILSLLKSVQVKPVDSTDGGLIQQQKLLEQIHKYNEWCKYSNQLKSSEAVNHFSHFGNFNLIQITDGAQSFNTTGENNNSQVLDHIKCSNDEGSKSHERNNFLMPTNKVRENDDCKTETVVNDKSDNIYKRRLVHKPFSVGDILKTIRSEELHSENKNKVGQSEEIIVKKNTNNEELEISYDSNDGEVIRSFEKKQRKRIRKHKSKRKGSVSDVSNASINAHNSFSDDGILKSPEKPKHIRFEVDKDDMEYEINCNNIEEDQENILNGFSDENKKIDLSLQQLKDIIKEKKKIMSSLNKDENEKVDLSANESQEWKFSQSVSMNDGDENKCKVLGADDGKKMEEYDVLQALQSMRNQNEKPLIFKRFN